MTETTLPIFQVDAFTHSPFTGNPAGVCLLSAPVSEAWLQLVAREMNLSETAFLLRQGEDFQLRWFTPTTEVDLCGHATLASAHVLWQEGYWPQEHPLTFQTRSGRLRAGRVGDWIELDFPAYSPLLQLEASDLAAILGCSVCSVWSTAIGYLLVEVESAETVQRLKPDQVGLAQLSWQGIIVTAPTTDGNTDFISRFFAPRLGIPEDPVTGSAHCCLGPFWQQRLNRSELLGYQASERGGWVRVHCRGDRVHLGGQAVTVLRGAIAHSSLRK
jgi:PhzF family phenazine biosynthesis protein